MVKYTTTLTPSYYSISDGIIYNISNVSDGDVHTKKLPVEKQEEIFPHVKVTYTNEENQTKTQVYWYKSLVRVGDKYSDANFTPEDCRGRNYKEVIENDMYELTSSLIADGYSDEYIKNVLPEWASFAKNKKYKIEGVYGTVEKVEICGEEYITPFNEKLDNDFLKDMADIYLNKEATKFLSKRKYRLKNKITVGEIENYETDN